MRDDERLFPLPASAAPPPQRHRPVRRCSGCGTELEGAAASQDGRGVWRCMPCTLVAVAAGERALLTAAPDQLTFGEGDEVDP